MSFDPHGYSQDPEPPPPSGSPGYADIPPGPPPVNEEAARRDARARVMLPAIFLIVVGMLNLLWVAMTALYAVQARMTPVEALRQQMLQTPNGQQQLQQLDQAGYSLADIKYYIEVGSWTLSGGGLLFSVLIVVGGIRMLQLRNWGLVIFSSLLAGIPFLSGAACPCCGVGDLIAIWCLVVLLQSDVRAAFR